MNRGLTAAVTLVAVLMTSAPTGGRQVLITPITCAPTPVASASAFAAMWDNSPDGFVAGDMGFSVAHPTDGSGAFIFGDSALNTPAGRAFVHSAMVRWSSTGLTRVVGSNPDGSFLPDPDSDGPQVYWPISAVVDAGKLYVFADRVQYGSGSGLFNFTTHGRDLVVYNWPACATPTLAYVAATPSSGRPTTTDAPRAMWGAGAVSYGGYVYVYGTYSESTWYGANRTYLARVPSGQLERPSSWRYWSGTSWDVQESHVAIVNDEQAHSTEATLSVHRVGLAYRMVTKSTILADNARLYTSPNPYGPWTTVELYPCPWGTGADHAYGAFGHEELPKTADGKFLSSVGHNHDGGQLTDMWDHPEWYRVSWTGIN
jgi:hypothetical protein